MKKYICQSCGGELLQGANNSWKCSYCQSTWYDETVQRDAEEILKIVGDYNEAQKTERVSNIRRQLYDAVNSKYINSEEILRLCRRLKEFLPGDFMANFYEAANQEDRMAVSELIDSIDPEECSSYIEGILTFMIKSIIPEYHLPLVNLVERAYGKDDNERFEKYHTMIQTEITKFNEGVYETSLPRDVFVAYSSKDMPEVQKLVAYLESSGLKCFVAARNLRHGKGAVQNYHKALEDAIRNCYVFLLVSTPNSRSLSCDTLKYELPFLKAIDIECAPPEFKQNYETMPSEYKKHRIEYMLKSSMMQVGGDSAVKQLFDGCEYAKSYDEIVSRIAQFRSDDLVRSRAERNTVKEIVTVKETVSASGAGTESLLKRVFMFLEDGDFKAADEYCEKVLDIDPECARAYLGKLMVECQVRKQNDLAKLSQAFNDRNNYKKAIRFGDASLRKFLDDCIKTINERNRLAALEAKYVEASRKMNAAKTEAQFKDAASLFEKLGTYRDSVRYANECRKKAVICREEAEEEQRLQRYNYATYDYRQASRESEYKSAAEKFDSLGDYKDSKQMAKKCREGAEDAAARERRRRKAEEEKRIEKKKQAEEHFNRGVMLEKQHKYSEAAGEYTTAINLGHPGAQKAHELVTDKILSIARKKEERKHRTGCLIKVVAVLLVLGLVAFGVTKCVEHQREESYKPENMFSFKQRLMGDKNSYTLYAVHAPAYNQPYPKEVTLPSMYDGKPVTAIGEDYGATMRMYDAFKGTGFEKIILPNTITTIYFRAFRDCINLKNVVIPNSVNYIDGFILTGCTSFESITFLGTMEEWEEIEKDSDWANDGILTTLNFTVHCTDGDITIN